MGLIILNTQLWSYQVFGQKCCTFYVIYQSRQSIWAIGKNDWMVIFGDLPSELSWVIKLINQFEVMRLSYWKNDHRINFFLQKPFILDLSYYSYKDMWAKNTLTEQRKEIIHKLFKQQRSLLLSGGPCPGGLFMMIYLVCLKLGVITLITQLQGN